MLLKFLTVAERVTVKKLNTTEYRQYLKLWNEETKPKQENTKDLPKLNQVKCPGPCRPFHTQHVQVNPVQARLTSLACVFSFSSLNQGPIY